VVYFGAGLSQKEASEKLDISRATLQNYENGKTTPDVLMSRKIEELYRFPTDYILFGTNTA